MTSTQAAKKKISRTRAKRAARRRRTQPIALFFTTLFQAAASVAALYTPSLTKIPQHTSSLTGFDWLQELLSGHPVRFYYTFGMEKHVFKKLVLELSQFTGLTHSKYVRMEEQVAIFLFMARSGCSNRTAQERFQRSGDTISR